MMIELTEVVCEAELSLLSVSGIAEATVPTLVIDVPPETELLTVATRVTTTDAPLAIDENVTVRLLPAPPQTPLPVAEQEMKVNVLGRLSVTMTDGAGSGPLLVTASA